jgi:hypothetical protein
MKIDTYASGFLLVSTSTLLAVLGLLVVQRLLHRTNLMGSHDVGGYLFSAVGTMYAVILGLVVVESMAKFEEARQTTERESNSLADIVLLANQLPKERREKIQKLAIAYADRVVHDEWPVLDHGHYAPVARFAAIDLITAVCDYEPKTTSEQTIYESQVNMVCELWNDRRARTNLAAHGVPYLEWVVLIIGGIITMGFTYFFKTEHWKIQATMTAMVAAMISLNLYLVLMFGYPYSGELKVSAEGFKVSQAIIERQQAERR